MKTFKLISIISVAILTITVLVFLGGEFKAANIKIESDRVATAKAMCESGSKWVKLKGELNTRSCKTFKKMY